MLGAVTLLAFQVAAGGVGPADLLSRTQDRNGFPLNPFWQVQDTSPTARPAIGVLCALRWPRQPAAVADYFGNPGCTSQLARLSVEAPLRGFSARICDAAALREPRFPGHLNWFPVTVTGQGNWLHVDLLDHDANFLLRPDPVGPIPMPGITSRIPGGKSAYKLEFDSREVFEAIATTHAGLPLWDRALNSQERKRTLNAKRYVAIGLFSLDAEHEYWAELHPVWGLAIQVQADADAESWIVFARNSGNEGGCSSRARLLLPAGEDGYSGLRFDLPSALANPGVAVEFRDIFGRDATVHAEPANHAVRLDVPLGTPSLGVQLLFGEVRLTRGS